MKHRSTRPKRQGLPLRAALVVLLSASLAAPAGAALVRDSDAGLDAEPVETDGCDGPEPTSLNRVMPVTVGDVRLEVPFGYIEGWPTPERLRGPNDWDGLSFEFFMPCKRYLTRKGRIDPLVGYAPPERRPFDGYSVRVVDLRWAVDTPTPWRQFLNRQGYLTNEVNYSPESEFVAEEAYGLIRYRRVRDPKGDHFVRYRNEEGANVQLFFDCTPLVRGLPNPGCTGDVLIKDKPLSFFVHFPLDAMPEWRGIVDAVEELAEGWRVE